MDNRKNILKCLGDFPKKVNLETKELNSEDMGDYIRKLIEYTVEKCNERIKIQNNSIIEKVQAYVLIPKKLMEKLLGYWLYINIIVIGRLENPKSLD